MRPVAMIAALVLCGICRAGESPFVLEQTAVDVDFNGVSIGSDGFAVLVGDGGTVLHRTTGNDFQVVESGTEADLFDVFVVDATTAVATGQGVVLRWDGAVWATIVDDPADPLFTSVWVSPEKDVAIYNVPDGQFVLHTAYDLAAGQPLGLSAVSGFDLAYCGSSNDIKAIVRNGSIVSFDNRLRPIPGTEGTFGTLFDNLGDPLALSAAWLPPGACFDGPTLPFQAFAIDDGRTLYHYRVDRGWQTMPIEDGGIPVDQTLTWIGGVGPSLIYATGFRPDGDDGNEGVLWRWDGELWREQALPPGVSGMTDLAVAQFYEDRIFDDGFETGLSAKSGQLGPGSTVDLYAAVEQGGLLHFGDRERLFGNVTDLEVLEKRVLTPPPYGEGTEITYEFSVRNNGPNDTKFHIGENLLTVDPSGFATRAIRFVSSTCSLDPGVGSFGLAFAFSELAAGEIFRCEVTWRLGTSNLAELRNSVSVSTLSAGGAADLDPGNNRITILTPNTR